MAIHSLPHLLALSQAQVDAFVKFKDLGSEFFYQYGSLAKRQCWGQARYELVILSSDRTPAVERNFLLNEQQIKSLGEMLELVDDLQTSVRDEAAENLYQKILASLAIFRAAVEKVIAKNIKT